MDKITPVFTSTYSVGRSILTLDEPEEIKNTAPVSIFSIAKQHNLSEVYLLENNLSGFITAYKSAEKANVHLKFGLRLYICSDINKKDEESLHTEHKLNVWCLNSAGYKDLL